MWLFPRARKKRIFRWRGPPELHALVTVLWGGLCASPFAAVAGQGSADSGTGLRSLWAHDNLTAWCIGPFDGVARGPEERAQMLARLGFKSYAYLWFDPSRDPPAFDAEIDAMSRHGIRIVAWWFPFEAHEVAAKSTLEILRRHHIRPQLWITHLPSDHDSSVDDWGKLREAKNGSGEAYGSSDELHVALQRTAFRLSARTETVNDGIPSQVDREVYRIQALIDLVKPYGNTIALYNHGGWFGSMNNQLAIIRKLEELGVKGVGIVYNFSHARDAHHDETAIFNAIWREIASYVVAVNVTGTAMEGTVIYPSEGDRELEMMRIIEESGWLGPIGLTAEKGGDAELTLRNDLIGLDWLAAELRQPGSGGPRPFQVDVQRKYR